jgi:hypothetical protein
MNAQYVRDVLSNLMPMLIFLSYNEQMCLGSIPNIALQALAIDGMLAG